MNLNELRNDCAIKQKKGLHFILASIIIWLAVLFVNLSSLPVLTKNLLTFCATAPIMPLAYFISKIIKVEFNNKDNPLNNLGVLFSVNQILYLLIAMWIYQAVPDKMVMVIAIIFGAHLLPFGWLYKSKTYMGLSVIIPLSILIIGIKHTAVTVSIVMIFFEIIFSILLVLENKQIK